MSNLQKMKDLLDQAKVISTDYVSSKSEQKEILIEQAREKIRTYFEEVCHDAPYGRRIEIELDTMTYILVANERPAKGLCSSTAVERTNTGTISGKENHAYQYVLFAKRRNNYFKVSILTGHYQAYAKYLSDRYNGFCDLPNDELIIEMAKNFTEIQMKVEQKIKTVTEEMIQAAADKMFREDEDLAALEEFSI